MSSLIFFFPPKNKGHTLGEIDKIWWYESESENTLFFNAY